MKTHNSNTIIVVVLLVIAVISFTWVGMKLVQKSTPPSPQDYINFEDICELKDEDILVLTTTGSKSMMPLADKPTHQVLVKRTFNIEEIKPGDIIVFQENDTFISHRVIGIENEYFITKGDNNLDSEEVPKENVFGVVVGVIY